MEKTENMFHVETSSVATLAMAAGSRYLLSELGPVVLGSAVAASPVMVGTLLAAGAFYMSKLFTVDGDKEQDGKILESLQRTSLDVHIQQDGQISTTVSTSTEAAASVKLDQQVKVENHQGTTVIHIDNLIINLNAEMVQQLNLNPKEVINQLTEQIKETTLKNMVQESKNLEPKTNA